MTVTESLTRRGVRWRRSTSDANEISFNCPFCPENRGTEDYGFSFHLNVKSGAGHCWHADCDFKSRHAAKAVLRKFRAETDVLDGGVKEPEVEAEPVRLPADFTLLSQTTDDLDQMALDYLLKRGVTKEQIARHRIGVSYSGTYAYRIVFPVREKKVLRAIVARDFTGRSKRRYLNSAGEAWLWNFNPAAEEVILAEGIFKALRLATALGKEAGALLGHNFTDNKLKQILNSKCRHVILWPDPDKVGRRGVVTVAEKLIENWKGRVSIVWPVTAPADEVPFENLQETARRVCAYNWTLTEEILSRK